MTSVGPEMPPLVLWSTGHVEADRRLHTALSEWQQRAERIDLLSSPEFAAAHLQVLPPEVEITANWAASYCTLALDQQLLLAFAWLDWWQHAPREHEAGFAGWLRRGPGLVLNHLSYLKMTTDMQSGVLHVLHLLLETVIEQAGDWNGDPESKPAVVRLLQELDEEYRSHVHGHALWPAVVGLADAFS